MFKAQKPIIKILTLLAISLILSADAKANFAPYPQLMSFGSYGDETGNFKNPYGVAADKTTGDIYIVDTGNSQIKKFDRFGQYIIAYGSQGTADGQFLYPQGITLDNNGYLYVVETEGSRVQKFNISGGGFTFVSKFGSKGSGNGQFFLPRDIALDSSGNIFVCDSGNNRISKFNASGTWVSNIGGSSLLKGPYGFGLDGTGNIYVADTYNHRIIKISQGGLVLLQFGSFGSAGGQFSYPRDVLVDDKGDIFVADTENHRIQRFNSSGNFLNTFGVYTEFLTPQKIFLDSDHRMHVVDSNTNRIQVYDVNTYLKDVYISPNPFSPDGDGVVDTTAIHYTIPEPSKITITIYDKDNNLVKNLITGVQKIIEKNTDIWDGTNNSNMPVSAGNYTIKIDAVNLTNYHPPQGTVAVSVIFPTGSIAGMVTDGTNPVAGVRISDGVRSSLTDASGHYTLVNVPDGQVMLSAEKSGYQDGRQIINLNNGEIMSGVDFMLNRVGDPDIRVSPNSLNFVKLMGDGGMSGSSVSMNTLSADSLQPQVSVLQDDVTKELNYEVKLKSKSFTPVKHEAQAQKDVSDKAQKLKKENIHVLVQLDRTPSDADKKALKDAGIELLSYVPNHAWLASVKSSKASELNAVPLVRWVGALSVEDKISPRIRFEGVPSHAVNKDGTVTLRLQFFKDVQSDAAEQAVVLHGGKIVSTSKLLNTMTIFLPADALNSLADEDAVQWIEETSPKPIELNDGIRDATGVNSVQTAPYDLSGKNVVMGIWDGAHVDATHDDFGDRVVYGDSAEIGEHATHVAGTASGAGILSARLGGSDYQWKGMAPNAQIVSCEWTDAVPEHETAINNYWIDISQNSWGFIVESTNCSFYGDYTLTVSEYDSIVRGGYGKPLNILFAAGNERTRTDCNIPARSGFSTIAPPATGKNIITVGAINSDNNTMTTFSSWGPVDDGRIKPDLVAPGCEAGGEKYIHSALPGDIYGGINWCGTSMATPAVSGIAALMIEQFRTTFNADPLPSTVKGILVHTAHDLESAGPDFKTGYGLVDAKSAVDIIKDKALIEGTINITSEINTYTIEVPQGSSELKVTLAWDDAPGSPNSASELVNDLDLVLISPQSAQYLPWKLNPATPSAPAAAGADHLNNIEQVSVANPAAGVWTVRVTGTAVPQPTQRYSLVSNRFGSADLKYATQKIMTLSNEGDMGLAVSSITTNLPWLSVDKSSLTISPGSSAGIKVAVNGTNMTSGTYSGQIQISSNDPNESVVVVPVNYIIDSPPSAVLDGPYAADEGQPITMNGSGSSDPDGYIVLYQWDINNDGTYEYSSITSAITHTYAQQSAYTINLKVTDDQGATGETATTAFITDTSPTADFSGSPTDGALPLTVTFTDLSSGYDQPLTYEWDFNNDGTVDSTDRNPSYTYGSVGVYTVRLKVTDADGSTNTLTQSNYVSVWDVVHTIGNNFTMLQSGGGYIGGSNDVTFHWDGTRKTVVAASGQVSNAAISSTCPFQGITWSAHDVGVYGPGTYTVYTGCASGSPGCGLGTAMTFTVKTGEIGAHMLFNWNDNNDIDVVNIWKSNAVFGPSRMWTGGPGSCETNAVCTIWGLMSYDWDGDGNNGGRMVDGPFVGFSANFSFNKGAIDVCCDAATRCNDNSACTTDTCNTATGACSNTPIVCNDNNLCTIDTCNTASGCVFTPKDCNDNNLCTTDSCNTATGLCSNVAIVCPDNNACTTDFCNTASGLCAHLPIFCNDNNACTTDNCNTATGCVYTPKPPCNDNNICTTDTCNTVTGCVFANNTLACSDNNYCTVGDTCANGVCVPGAPKVCNDNNICTTDTCIPVLPTGCVYSPNTLACNDNNACTVEDVCKNGACTGTAKNCNDNDSCTTDSCSTVTGNCVRTPSGAPGCVSSCTGQPNGTQCTDLNACTLGDTCQNGICVSGPVRTCNDNNQCTSDVCDTLNGCVFTINDTLPCFDGNYCTDGDYCLNGKCIVGVLRSCDDGNPCTDDKYVPVISQCCIHPGNTKPCNDGNSCTINDVCNKTTLVCAGTAKNCNDYNACTTDSCATATGNCVNTWVPSCPSCVGKPDGTACSDNNACTVDVCTNNVCVSSTPQVCNDNNPCTTDTCSTATGCIFTNNTLSCDDSNSCTVGDVCLNGVCKPGPLMSCDDGNVCTTDAAAPFIPVCCIHSANTLACNDNNACTVGDVCANKACVPGSPKVCNDNNPCTTDSCSTATGACAFVNNTLTCDDNNVCTTGDVCSGGVCAGTPKTCDDNNICTTDSCNATTGQCVHTNNTEVCTDNNACTLSDYCSGGVCISGTTKVCSFGGVCTPDTGCPPRLGPHILWHDTATSSVAVWLMDGTTQTGYVEVGSAPLNWQIAGVGDFNDDGKPDILWRNTSTGENAVWYMDGATLTESVFLDPITDLNWKIVGTGDFNNDGKPDIVWRNTSTGENSVWYMDGVTKTGYAFLDPITDLNWKLVGTGDFNNDGKPDIVWRNTSTGENSVWYMDGITKTGYAFLIPTTDLNWQLAGVGDFNGDSKPDILWRNTSTGENLVWFMNGITQTGSVAVGSAPLSWQIRGLMKVTGVSTKIGISRSSGEWWLDVNGSHTWDAGDIFMAFGVADAIPVVGDWDGAGTTKIGAFKDGVWYLDRNNNGVLDSTPDDVIYNFGSGMANARPVTGDWTRAGTAKIGIYSAGTWYLDLNGNGTWNGAPTDAQYSFGNGVANAIPVTGDWTGTGSTRIGIFADGTWLLDLNGNGVWEPGTDALFNFGVPGDVPVTGDWTGSGKTKIGVFRNGQWYWDMNGNGAWDGTPTDAQYFFDNGVAGAVPVTGKW